MRNTHQSPGSRSSKRLKKTDSASATAKNKDKDNDNRTSHVHKNNGGGVKDGTKKNPSLRGKVVEYENILTNRLAYGLVGRFSKAERGYLVQFIYADDKLPRTYAKTLAQEWVESNLVHDASAKAWIEALHKHNAIDSPSRKKSGTSHPQSETRARNSPNTPPSVSTDKGKDEERQLVFNEDVNEEAKDSGDPKEGTNFDHDSGDDGTPTKLAKKRKMKRKSGAFPQLEPGLLAMVLHHVREALYDIRPSARRVKPFMYWNANKDTACAKMLIRRTPALQLLANNYRRNEFARMIADDVRLSANNEKSSQIRQLKLLFLNDKSDYTLVTDYQIGSSAHGIMKDMTICNSLNSEFSTIEELRKVICSADMYTYPKLFDMFCAGLESGRLRGTIQVGISPIEDLITLSHEAHFRLELWFALTAQSFRHDNAKAASDARKIKHQDFCALVARDRRNNATEAFNHRSTNMAEHEGGSESNSDSEDGVNSEFY